MGFQRDKSLWQEFEGSALNVLLVLSHPFELPHHTGRYNRLINQQLAERVLTAALEQGADFAELFLEDSEANRIVTTDGAVENAVSSRTCGAVARVMPQAPASSCIANSSGLIVVLPCGASSTP